MLKRSDRRSLGIYIGQAVLVTGGIYIWMYDQHGLELLVYAAEGSLIMLLTISLYYIIRYISEESSRNNAAWNRFILWCGSNIFGIYLIEDYLRNGTVMIWESLGPYISAMPACIIWLLTVFLIGNVLVTGLRRLPLLRKLL